MSKKYAFVFHGSMQEFLELLDNAPVYRSLDGKERYYLDRYIVEISDGDIRFGVMRVGHSGGKWYCPTVTEHPDRVEFCGEILLAEAKEGKVPTFWDRVQMILFGILFSPLVLLACLGICLYSAGNWAISKIRHIPSPWNEEENLNCLMQHHLHCTKTDSSLP